MWTPTTRRQHSRAGLRNGSDLTDAEWAILEPLLPAPATSGRKRARPIQDVVNANFYILRGGVPWRLIPVIFRLGAQSVTVLRAFAITGHLRNSTMCWSCRIANGPFVEPARSTDPG